MREAKENLGLVEGGLMAVTIAVPVAEYGPGWRLALTVERTRDGYAWLDHSGWAWTSDGAGNWASAERRLAGFAHEGFETTGDAAEGSRKLGLSVARLKRLRTEVRAGLSESADHSGGGASVKPWTGRASG